uniref:WAT1-related protein n=1 Tax=Arundo donax TaxID=35708 RepID=A0A0A9D6I4_ARUDO
MALPIPGMGGLWMRYAPQVLMTIVQLCYTLLYFITEAAFNRGLNPYVYVTYRHLLVAALLWPFAYLRTCHCWKFRRHSFFSSCCRVSLTLNMYFSSLKYTSPTFVTSMVNAVASITFVIATILR